MVLTAVSVVNQALVQIGSQAQITAFNDGSTEANTANTIYQNTINDLLRQFSWDFARKVSVLIASGQVAPLGWASELFYPVDGIEIRQILQSGPATTFLDPQPIRFAVASNQLNQKVVWTTVTGIVECVYTYQAPEAVWDSTFTEAAVNAVAEALSMGIAGRPDFAGKKLEETLQRTEIGKTLFY